MRSRNATRWRRAALAAPITLIALAGAGTGVAAAAAIPTGVIHAQPYPPSPPVATTSTATPCAGCAVTTTWTGFKPNSPISLTFFSMPVSLGTVMANASGVAVDVITIPAGTPPGVHTITGTGLNPDNTPISASIHITVTESETEPATGGPEPAAGGPEPASGESESPSGESERHHRGPELAHTGADLLVPTGIGAATVGVGTLAVLWVRRRSTSNPAGK